MLGNVSSNRGRNPLIWLAPKGWSRKSFKPRCEKTNSLSDLWASHESGFVHCFCSKVIWRPFQETNILRQWVQFHPLPAFLNPSIYRICELIKTDTWWHIWDRLFVNMLPLDAKIDHCRKRALFSTVYPAPHWPALLFATICVPNK